MTVAPVVAGVDGSEESRLALRWAFDYAQMSGAPVEAVIAWDIPPTYGWAPSYDDVDFEKMAQEALEKTVRGVLGDNAPVTSRVERGHPAPVLVAASERAQLLVVGSRGHGAFAGMLLGSVSQHCRSARALPGRRHPQARGRVAARPLTKRRANPGPLRAAASTSNCGGRCTAALAWWTRVARGQGRPVTLSGE